MGYLTGILNSYQTKKAGDSGFPGGPECQMTHGRWMTRNARDGTSLLVEDEAPATPPENATSCAVSCVCKKNWPVIACGWPAEMMQEPFLLWTGGAIQKTAHVV